MVKHRNADLAAVAIYACAAALVVAFVPSVVARTITATPLVLFLPGYALTRALPLGRLSDARQALLAIAASISLVVVGTVALDAVGIELGTSAWTALLVVATLTLTAVGAVWGQHEPVRATRVVVRLRSRDAALLTCAAVIVGGSLVLATTVLPAGRADGYTALSMVSARTKDSAVRIGVHSEEQHEQRYRLDVLVNGKVIDRRTLALEPGTSWDRILIIDSGTVPTQVAATLYRTGDPGRPYRHVRLELPTA